MNEDIEMSIGNDVTMRAASTASLGRIDHYELLKELGGGGFGTVYLARNTVAGIDVAVKGLPPLVRNNKEELENIRSNFALVQRLHHPNIAAALDLHPVREAKYEDKATAEKLRVFEGDTMMVMQYAPGVTLSQWRKQFPDGIVPEDLAIGIVWHIAQALDYAHEMHIIHRDVKPSNIMIETSPEGEIVARVLDFGLAAEVRSSMGRVSREVHDTSGTRPYMAPEQWAGKKQGPATDQYALAAMFCELATGEVPFTSVFECGDPVIMMTAVCNSVPELPASCPRSRVVIKALSKDPQLRYESCCAFAEALDKVEDVPIAPKKKRKHIWSGRNKCILSVALPILAVMMVCIGWGIVWLVRNGQGETPANDKRHEVATKTPAVIPERKRVANQSVPNKQVVTTVVTKVVQPEKSREELIAERRKVATKQAIKAFAQNDWASGFSFAKDADQDDVAITYHVASCYDSLKRIVDGVTKDDSKAVALYTKAAQKGYAPAQNSLGDMYESGKGVIRDTAKAVMWFRRAAEQCYGEAERNLGIQYAEGKGGLQRDEFEAAKLYDRALSHGDEEASFYLAKCYEKGSGVVRDEAKSLELYKRAAKYSKALLESDPHDWSAPYLLSRIYADGKGVPVDEVKAAEYCRIAADLGLPQAQNNLGLMYKRGEGVREDHQEAVRLYRMAAEAGESAAQYNLGSSLRYGEGVDKDPREAVVWFQKSAQGGGIPACKALGDMYRSGEGVEKNFSTALFYYEKAAAGGNKYAQGILNTLKRPSADTEESVSSEAVNKIIIDQMPMIYESSSRVHQRTSGDTTLETKFTTSDKNASFSVEWYVLLDSRKKSAGAPFTYLTASQRCQNVARGSHVAIATIPAQVRNAYGEPQAVGIVFRSSHGIVGGGTVSKIKGIKNDTKFWEDERIMKARSADGRLLIQEKEGLRICVDTTVDRECVGKSLRIAIPGCGAPIELVYCPPGDFVMGSDKEEDEKPHHVVLTRGFWIGKFPILQEQWKAVMGFNPSKRKGSKMPVESVSWDSCQEFIRKLNQVTGKSFSMLTEAQWEYAARAGSETGFAVCRDSDGWHAANSGNVLHQAGCKAPNRWGIYDMFGNVQEWCNDWYGQFIGNQSDPRGPAKGDRRVLKGGMLWRSGEVV